MLTPRPSSVDLRTSSSSFCRPQDLLLLLLSTSGSPPPPADLRTRPTHPSDLLLQKEEKKDAASAAELGLENVGGVFVVMVGGIALACLTACCEFTWKARKLATDDGVSFSEELGKELLFIINCKENSKPVRKKSSPSTTDSSSIYGSSNYGYSDKK